MVFELLLLMKFSVLRQPRRRGEESIVLIQVINSFLHITLIGIQNGLRATKVGLAVGPEFKTDTWIVFSILFAQDILLPEAPSTFYTYPDSTQINQSGHTLSWNNSYNYEMFAAKEEARLGRCTVDFVGRVAASNYWLSQMQSLHPLKITHSCSKSGTAKEKCLRQKAWSGIASDRMIHHS